MLLEVLTMAVRQLKEITVAQIEKGEVKVYLFAYETVLYYINDYKNAKRKLLQLINLEK